jgi:hypothetical protein
LNFSQPLFSAAGDAEAAASDAPATGAEGVAGAGVVEASAAKLVIKKIKVNASAFEFFKM